MGYAGRCAQQFLTGLTTASAAGAQQTTITTAYDTGDFVATSGISASYGAPNNVFEGQLHKDTDDYTFRYWDSGLKTTPTIGWEGHDEGDINPNAGSSSFSNFGEFTWMGMEEVAQLFNMTVAEATDAFNSENFKKLYKDVWIKDHEDEAAKENPNPEAELELVIEQLKNEKKPVDEPTILVQSHTNDEGDADDLTEDDTSGTARKLVSVATMFVSAALLFGI